MRLDQHVHRNHFRNPTLPSRRPTRTPGTLRASRQPQLAEARRLPTYHLLPRMVVVVVVVETRIIVQRSKQLPLFPPNAIRVVVRPRGQLRLRDVPTPRLMKAVQTALQFSLPDDFCRRIHPTNNTFTAATTHSAAAELLKARNSLTIGGHAYPCVAYVAPPPGATRGVISNVFDDETPNQLYEDLVRRKPEYSIFAAR
ncbi:hypothetical protein HPB51_018642 [Rhipicephalus microplus]|uniref:Uncharacterized protein n=1 Tax=Rhipicephalus microplus TaxID=6941 RepID=A0A9J6F867_RHIMP|nr:hypothetical protein HPB51_018642 [Rhipicephalus microplus]